MGVTPSTSAKREHTAYQLGESMLASRHLNILDKWLNPDHVRLYAGEMTAQEMRSVLAVLRAVRLEIAHG